MKLCKTITAGGAYVLKRGKHNGVEDSSSCSEDSSDSSEDNSDSSEDISCDEDTSGAMMNRSCGCIDIGTENLLV